MGPTLCTTTMTFLFAAATDLTSSFRNALVDVMYGTTSPSGKLPYTIAKQPSDYGAGWNSALVDNFVEDLFIDYRHFQR
jgi:hypothetical protein